MTMIAQHDQFSLNTVVKNLEGDIWSQERQNCEHRNATKYRL
jgi:hypothetical protein